MEYKILKLCFQNAVHFGKRMLTDAEPVFYADTLFSALCQEALRMPGGIQELYQRCTEGSIRFSDALPYIGDELYIPKPCVQIESDESSKLEKAYKKLKYIPISQMKQALGGTLDAPEETRKLSAFGYQELRTNASIFIERTNEDTVPYHVGAYHYNEGNGLYICFGYETEDDLWYFSDLIDALSVSGIGGRRSSGMGQFTVTMAKCPAELEQRLNQENSSRYMSLSVSYPQKEEMESALEKAYYSLLKRSGFVASDTYSEHFQKKKDFYVFASGACFAKKFHGGIYDVSHIGNHPVYRYAFPMFIGVD